MPAQNLQPKSVVIANGQSLSAGVELQAGGRMWAIVGDAAWTAANLTFQASVDGGLTYFDLYDDVGAEVTVVFSATQRFVQLSNPQRFLGIQWLKVRSGTGAVPVAQGAARTLTLAVVA